MSSGFLKKLSKEEENAFLEDFLEPASLKFENTAQEAVSDGIRMDYSIKSIPPFMRWILKKWATISEHSDPVLPGGLQKVKLKFTFEATKHKIARLMFRFDARWNELAHQAGYYLGESFVRSYSSLRWRVGYPDRTEWAGWQSPPEPVLAGFRQNDEMDPIKIASNLLGRVEEMYVWRSLSVRSREQEVGDIERVVERWSQKV